MDKRPCITELLKAAAALSERGLNDALSRLGVSHCQAQIILRLQREAVSMSELSTVLCCHKSNVTQIVDGLVRKRLLHRVRSTKDRRVCQLALTQAGRAICRTVAREIASQAHATLSVFTPAEQQEFLRLLASFVRSRQDAGHTPLRKARPSPRGEKRGRSTMRSTT